MDRNSKKEVDKKIAKEKSIVLKVPEIDASIVSAKYKHGDNGDNSTKYTTCKGDSIEKDKLSLTSGYCFSSLLKMIHDNKESHDTVYYKMEENPEDCQVVKLTTEEKHRWISMCVEHGTMPKYISSDDIDAKIMKIDITSEGMTPPLLFLYLCSFRYFREDPGFIRSMVYLVDKCKMDYYIAFVVSSRICMNYDLHHSLSVVRKYGEKIPNISELEIPIHTAIGLRRFVNNPSKYDKRDIWSYNPNEGFNQFRCAQLIESICKTKYRCSIPDTFDHNIVKAVNSDTDEEAKKYINDFDLYKKNITHEVIK